MLGEEVGKCSNEILRKEKTGYQQSYDFFPFEPGACSVNSCNMGDAGLPLHRDCNVRRMGGDSGDIGSHDGGMPQL